MIQNLLPFILLVFGILLLYFGGLLLLRATEPRERIIRWAAIFLALLVVVICLIGMWWKRPLLNNTSWWGWLYGLNSLLTMLIYRYDKKAAGEGAWRINSSTIHILGFLGGWPGALIAQPLFKHKTNWRKEFKFKSLTILIAMIHVVLWIWWRFY